MVSNGEISETGAQDKQPAPPYISYVTFKNSVTWLESECVPVRFDRSFWGSKFAGSTGIQLMSALRFLGLLDGDKPQPDLHRLVEKKGQDRKAVLKEIITKRYTKVNFEHLKGATPSMVDEWFRGYPSIDGSTIRKAVSFFINACKEAGIELSKSVSKKARIRGPKPKLGSKDGKTLGDAGGKLTVQKPPAADLDDNDDEASTKTKITLDSGGEVVVSLSVDLFRLSKADRDYVLSLVDLAQSYKKVG